MRRQASDSPPPLPSDQFPSLESQAARIASLDEDPPQALDSLESQPSREAVPASNIRARNAMTRYQNSFLPSDSDREDAVLTNSDLPSAILVTKLSQREPGSAALLDITEQYAVVVRLAPLLRYSSVLRRVFEEAQLPEGGLDEDKVIELCGRDDAGIPTSSSVQQVRYFAAWLKRRECVEPSVLKLGDEALLPSVQKVDEHYDDLWDCALARLVCPAVLPDEDADAPWKEYPQRPMALLQAAELGNTLGCDDYINVMLTYFGFYARKELRHAMGDWEAVGQRWWGQQWLDEHPGATPYDVPRISETAMNETMKWLRRTMAPPSVPAGNSRPSV